ncbi:MAG TPA: hypothetical protein VNO31_12410 [Umezawaea sp.]|nr:hypothetical protein [Umezawaea sp.]
MAPAGDQGWAAGGVGEQRADLVLGGGVVQDDQRAGAAEPVAVDG